ncbi:MAG: PepSY domain-containing protein [Sporomusaceae bacterium]|jgi:uncharacterized membrane protein YkoI|nr:PepSY domain-containing protein [Sporomusaceae bacterium]
MVKLNKLVLAVFICLAVIAACAVPAAQAAVAAPDTSLTATADQIVPLDRNNGDRHRRNLPAPKITYGQAEEIALKSVEGSDYVKDVDLDYEKYHDGWIYEVEVITKDRQEFEVYISGDTGEVLKVRKDYF